MAFCSKCGKQISAESGFCPACGAPTQGEPVPVAPTASASSLAPHRTVSRDEGFGRWARIRVPVSIGLLALLIVAFLLATGFADSPHASGNSLAASAFGDSLIVRGEGPTGFQIGAYKVNADHDRPRNPELSLRAAIKVFGKPTHCTPAGAESSLSTAYVEWTIGSQALTAQYVPAPPKLVPYRNPCTLSPTVLYAASISTLRGSQWHTNRGLRIGDHTARIERLYPEAHHESQPPDVTSPEAWTIGKIPIRPCEPHTGCQEGPSPSFEIDVQKGRVSGFEVLVQGAER